MYPNTYKLTLRFTAKHPDSEEERVYVCSLKDIWGFDNFEILGEFCNCDCESNAPESNVVECNCDEYYENFDITKVECKYDGVDWFPIDWVME